jgi:hypothetical protein
LELVREILEDKMANALYDLARQSFLSGGIKWDADAISVLLVSDGYAVNLATHHYLTCITAGARINNSIGLAITSPTILSGVADGADVTFTAVTGNTAGYIVIYQSTGLSTTSQLIAYIDTATGLPVLPNGGDITVQWDNTAGLKIFML